MKLAENGGHQNAFGKFGTDSKAGVTNLADEISTPADQLDLLLYAKTHLTQALGDFTGCGELLDTNHRAGPNAAQWADGWLCAVTFADDL